MHLATAHGRPTCQTANLLYGNSSKENIELREGGNYIVTLRASEKKKKEQRHRFALVVKRSILAKFTFLCFSIPKELLVHLAATTT